MFRPQTLADVVYFAKQEESRLAKYPQPVKTALKYNPAHQGSSSSTYESSSVVRSTAHNNQGMTGTRLKLTSNEIADRRGLCFYCDDAYTPGRKCGVKLYMIIGEE